MYAFEHYENAIMSMAYIGLVRKTAKMFKLAEEESLGPGCKEKSSVTKRRLLPLLEF
jgi:hypothetical protein